MNDDQAERITEALNDIGDKLAALVEETRENRFVMLDTAHGAPDGHHFNLWFAQHKLPRQRENAAMNREAPLVERKYQRRKTAEAARLELHELKQRRDRMHDATRKAELEAEVAAKLAAVNALLAKMKAEDAADDEAFEAGEAARIEAQRKEIGGAVDHLECVTRARLAESLDEAETAECEDVLESIAEARENVRAA